jgi:hypothetical protein
MCASLLRVLRASPSDRQRRAGLRRFPVPPAWVSAVRSKRAADAAAQTLEQLRCPSLSKARGILSKRTLKGLSHYLVHWWPEVTTVDENELGPTRWLSRCDSWHCLVFAHTDSDTRLTFAAFCDIARDVLACSRLCVGYVMEFETFGNVEPSLSEQAVRKLELAAEQREQAATSIQKVERGRRSRKGLAAHHKDSERERTYFNPLALATLLDYVLCAFSSSNPSSYKNSVSTPWSSRQDAHKRRPPAVSSTDASTCN